MKRSTLPIIGSISLLLASYSPAVQAHYPHDPASFVAVSPGPSPEWVTTSIFRNEAWIAARTNDDRNMEYFYVLEGTDTFVSGGAMLSATHLALTTEGSGLWQSPDAGESWSNTGDLASDADLTDIEASPDILNDGVALLVGQAGIWRTDDAGLTWYQVYSSESTRWVDVDMAPDFADSQSACAVSDQGRVLCTMDGGVSWNEEVDLAQRAWSITIASEGGIFVGMDTEEKGPGGIQHRDPKTEEWISLGFEGESVTTIESLADGTLLMALPLEGVWRSTDQGLNWELFDFDLETISPSQNGPRGEHFFEFETTHNGSVYAATWEGLVRSDDGGQTWNRIHTALQQTIRDVDLGLDRNGQLLVLMASYGGGLQLADLRGTTAGTLTGSGQGLYLRHAAVTPDFGNDGIAMVASSGDLLVSQDAGSTWEKVNGEAGETHLLASSPQPEQDLRLFSNTSIGGHTAFFYSIDQGMSWVEGSVDIPCDGNGSAFAPSATYGSDGIIWGSCTGDGSIYQSLDRGESWTRKALPGVATYSLQSIEEGSAVLAGTADGLLKVTSEGVVSPLGFTGEQLHCLAASANWSEDPTILVISAQGTWARSTDGGSNWEDLDPAAPGYFLDLVMSPDFDKDGVIVAAGYPGVYGSIDSGQTWQNLNLVQLHEEVSPHWSTTTGWRSEVIDGASGGGYAAGDTGEQMAINLRAVGFDLLAPMGPEGGTLSIRIGSEQEEVSLQAEEEIQAQVIWSTSGLSDSWHTLEIEVIEGQGAIDGVRAWSADVMPWQFAGGGDSTTDTGDTGGTGSGTGAGDAGSDSENGGAPDTADLEDTGATGPPLTRCSGCAQGSLAILALVPLLWTRRVWRS